MERRGDVGEEGGHVMGKGCWGLETGWGVSMFIVAPALPVEWWREAKTKLDQVYPWEITRKLSAKNRSSLLTLNVESETNKDDDNNNNNNNENNNSSRMATCIAATDRESTRGLVLRSENQSFSRACRKIWCSWEFGRLLKRLERGGCCTPRELRSFFFCKRARKEKKGRRGVGNSADSPTTKRTFRVNYETLRDYTLLSLGRHNGLQRERERRETRSAHTDTFLETEKRHHWQVSPVRPTGYILTLYINTNCETLHGNNHTHTHRYSPPPESGFVDAGLQ